MARLALDTLSPVVSRGVRTRALAVLRPCASGSMQLYCSHCVCRHFAVSGGPQVAAGIALLLPLLYAPAVLPCLSCLHLSVDAPRLKQLTLLGGSFKGGSCKGPVEAAIY